MTNLILPRTLRCKYCYYRFHFTDEDPEARKGNFLRPHSLCVAVWDRNGGRLAPGLCSNYCGTHRPPFHIGDIPVGGSDTASSFKTCSVEREVRGGIKTNSQRTGARVKALSAVGGGGPGTLPRGPAGAGAGCRVRVTGGDRCSRKGQHMRICVTQRQRGMTVRGALRGE